mgnify:CR=1 FL=1
MTPIECLGRERVAVILRVIPLQGGLTLHIMIPISILSTSTRNGRHVSLYLSCRTLRVTVPVQMEGVRVDVIFILLLLITPIGVGLEFDGVFGEKTRACQFGEFRPHALVEFEGDVLVGRQSQDFVGKDVLTSFGVDRPVVFGGRDTSHHDIFTLLKETHIHHFDVDERGLFRDERFILLGQGKAEENKQQHVVVSWTVFL